MKTMTTMGLVTISMMTAFTIGCAAPSDADEGAGEDEMTSTAAYTAPRTCGATKWAAAFTHYKKAVTQATSREANMCGENHVHLHQIVDSARKAVDLCPADFRKILAESPWAAPVRRELSGSLELAELTGKFSFVKEGGTYVWKNLESALASRIDLNQEGGAMPGPSIIFKPQGKVEIAKMLEPSELGTYRIGATALGGKIVMIHITIGGRTDVYELTMLEDQSYVLRKGNERPFHSFLDDCSA